MWSVSQQSRVCRFGVGRSRGLFVTMTRPLRCGPTLAAPILTRQADLGLVLSEVTLRETSINRLPTRLGRTSLLDPLRLRTHEVQCCLPETRQATFASGILLLRALQLRARHCDAITYDYGILTHARSTPLSFSPGTGSI